MNCWQQQPHHANGETKWRGAVAAQLQLWLQQVTLTGGLLLLVMTMRMQQDLTLLSHW